VKRLLAAAFLVTLAACGSEDSQPAGPSQLQVEDVTIGTGATAGTGDTVTIDYIASLTNGNVIDNSYQTGRPYTFRLGAGQAIAGVDQGIVGMRVGGKRRLTIPPSLAYGSSGQPPAVPPNATLRFEAELRAIAGR
jgi:FKBP-type peptidyl-prolyl cis-trans isomerase